MLFYLLDGGSQLPRRPTYPYATLRPDNWDDYGYKTTFHVVIYRSKDEEDDLGPVKILEINQKGGQTHLPEKPFRSLGKRYCSLGSSLDYYETVYKLGRKVRSEYLTSIGDVAWDDERRAQFEDLEGYRVSLLRFSGAERLVDEAAKFLKEKKKTLPSGKRGFSISFKTRFGKVGPSLVADFSFRRKGQLPNRINAVIGYNGTGKTKLLSNLAIVASEYGYDSKEEAHSKAAGRFVGTKPPFVRVIVVSYSAFDNFVIPDDDEAERVGYKYCGLRFKLPPDKERPIVRLRSDSIYGLKSSEQIKKDFLTALQRVREQKRMDALREAMRPILSDASFQRIGLISLFGQESEGEYDDIFYTLSSGHKIVVKIVLELVAYMDGDEPTLILIDEPETHLHPPLTAAFLKCVRGCLDTLNGFAIVATHSPVVLQELPSRYVRVLRRIGNRATMEEPDIETFGEAIGNITQHVFNLDDGSTDWHATLKTLTRDKSLKEIEELFDGKLGFAARSFVASEQVDLDD